MRKGKGARRVNAKRKYLHSEGSKDKIHSYLQLNIYKLGRWLKLDFREPLDGKMKQERLTSP